MGIFVVAGLHRKMLWAQWLSVQGGVFGGGVAGSGSRIRELLLFFFFFSCVGILPRPPAAEMPWEMPGELLLFFFFFLVWAFCPAPQRRKCRGKCRESSCFWFFYYFFSPKNYTMFSMLHVSTALLVVNPTYTKKLQSSTM